MRLVISGAIIVENISQKEGETLADKLAEVIMDWVNQQNGIAAVLIEPDEEDE